MMISILSLISKRRFVEKFATCFVLYAQEPRNALIFCRACTRSVEVTRIILATMLRHF